jgi:hypothetical protein
MLNKLSKTAKIILGILILIILGAGTFVVKNSLSPKLDTTSYYAVFLNNGQVYFGNIEERTEKEFVLTNVYYLQLENNTQNLQAQASSSNFTLVKLGNEIHGPTNEMYINNQNILFYEKLRSDSKVVQSIAGLK